MNKREKILWAGLELLATNGVHNTPMSAIAKAADTGMGTIYNYFPNKEVLINEIYVSIKGQEALVFEDWDPDLPLKTQFETYLSSIVHFFMERPHFFQFMEQVQASPLISQKSREEAYQSIDKVLKLIEKGQKNRIIKDVEISELLTFIGGAVISYLRWYFMQQNAGDNSLKNLNRMVWDAIKE